MRGFVLTWPSQQTQLLHSHLGCLACWAPQHTCMQYTFAHLACYKVGLACGQTYIVVGCQFGQIHETRQNITWQYSTWHVASFEIWGFSCSKSLLSCRDISVWASMNAGADTDTPVAPEGIFAKEESANLMSATCLCPKPPAPSRKIHFAFLWSFMKGFVVLILFIYDAACVTHCCWTGKGTCLEAGTTQTWVTHICSLLQEVWDLSRWSWKLPCQYYSSWAKCPKPDYTRLIQVPHAISGCNTMWWWLTVCLCKETQQTSQEQHSWKGPQACHGNSCLASEHCQLVWQPIYPVVVLRLYFKPIAICSKKVQVVQYCFAACLWRSYAASGKIWTDPDKVYCVSLSVWQFQHLLTRLPVGLHVLRWAYCTCHHCLHEEILKFWIQVDHCKIRKIYTIVIAK